MWLNLLGCCQGCHIPDSVLCAHKDNRHLRHVSIVTHLIVIGVYSSETQLILQAEHKDDCIHPVGKLKKNTRVKGISILWRRIGTSCLTHSENNSHSWGAKLSPGYSGNSLVPSLMGAQLLRNKPLQWLMGDRPRQAYISSTNKGMYRTYVIWMKWSKEWGFKEHALVTAHDLQ